MLTISGVSIVLFFLKLLNGNRNFWPNLCATNTSLHSTAVKYQKLYYKVKKAELDIKFLVKCQDNNITPKFICWKNLKSKCHRLHSSYHRRLLKESIHDQHKLFATFKTSLNEHVSTLKTSCSYQKFIAIKFNATRSSDKKLIKVSERHERKFSALKCDHCIHTGIKDNPNNIITNLTNDLLKPEEKCVLHFGLKHGLAT